MENLIKTISELGNYSLDLAAKINKLTAEMNGNISETSKWETAIRQASQLMDSLDSIMNKPLVNTIISEFETLKNKTKNVESAIQKFVGIFIKETDNLGEKSKPLLEKVKNNFTNFNTNLNKIFQGGIKIAKLLKPNDLISSMKIIFSSFYRDVKLYKIKFDYYWEEISESVGKKIDKIKNVINTSLSSIKNVIGKIVNSDLVSGITGMFGQISGGISDAIQKIMGIAMQAIAPAVLIGALLVGMGFVYQQYGTEIDNFLLLATTKGVEIIQSLITMIQDNIPLLIDQGVNLLTQLLELFILAFPSIVNLGVAIITSLITGVSDSIPTLIPTILSVIETFLINIIGAFPKILLAGMDLLLSLATGIANNIPEIVQTITNVISSLITTIIQNLPTILGTGITIIWELIRGIVSAVPQLIGQIPSILASVAHAFMSLNWSAIGSDIINGIKSGISNMASSLVESVKTAAMNALNGVKRVLGINSPSKVFRDEIGRWLLPGIAVGIEDTQGNLQSTLDDAAATLSFNPDFGKVDYGLTTGTYFTQPGADSQSDNMFDKLAVMLQMLEQYLIQPPQYAVVLDDGTLVGKMAPNLDYELKKISERKGR